METSAADPGKEPSSQDADRQVGFGPTYKWYVVGMLWCISFFNYADRQAIFSVLPLLEKEMHLTNADLGWLGSSFAWVYGLCSPFAGGIVDRVRRKTAILFGLQAWSLICMATALSRKFYHLVFFRAAEGLGETVYYPASVSLISDYHGKSTRSRALGFHQTSVYVGTIAGSFFGALIGQHFGWQWSFVVFGSLGVCLGLLLSRLLIEPRRGAADLPGQESSVPANASVHDTSGNQNPAPSLPRIAARTMLNSIEEVVRIVRTTPTVLFLLAAFMAANFGALVLLTWMPKFLYDKFHLSLTLAGLNGALFPQLASMLGAPLGGWFADLLRRKRAGGRILVQAFGVLGVCPFVVICGQTDSLTSCLLALTAWGLFKGIYDANIFASVFDVVRPESRGTIAGWMNMVGWLLGGVPLRW